MKYKLLFLISGKMVKDVFEGLWQWAVVYVSYSRSRETPSSPRVPRETGGLQETVTTGKNIWHTYTTFTPHPLHQSLTSHQSSCLSLSIGFHSMHRRTLGKGWAYVSCCRGLFPGVRKNLGWTHLLRPLSHLSSSAFCQNTEVDFCSSLI